MWAKAFIINISFLDQKPVETGIFQTVKFCNKVNYRAAIITFEVAVLSGIYIISCLVILDIYDHYQACLKK